MQWIQSLEAASQVDGTYAERENDTGSIRDDSYWISRKNSLELIELSSINKVGLV